jgi:hypothetical protein
MAWSERQPIDNNEYRWLAAALSSAGTVAYVGMYAGLLYKSTSSGRTWTALTGAKNPKGSSDPGGWYTMCTSSDGSVVIVAEFSGRVYRSGDGGDTWAETRPDGDRDGSWRCVRCNPAGTKVLLSEAAGKVYYSSTGGSSWVDSTLTNGNQWIPVAISGDGNYMFAGVYGGRLYRCTDGSGTSWAEVKPEDADRNWRSVACSNTGAKVYAVVYDNGTGNGKVWRSASYGATGTWSATGSEQPIDSVVQGWMGVSCNLAGDVVVCISSYTAGVQHGRAYRSDTSAVSWVESQPKGDDEVNWNQVWVDGDGYKELVSSDSAGSEGIGRVYTEILVNLEGDVDATADGLDTANLSRLVRCTGAVFATADGLDTSRLTRLVRMAGAVSALSLGTESDDPDLNMANTVAYSHRMSGTVAAVSNGRRTLQVSGSSPETKEITSSLIQVSQSFLATNTVATTNPDIVTIDTKNLMQVNLTMYRVGKPGPVYVDLRECTSDNPVSHTPISGAMATAFRNGNTLSVGTAGAKYTFLFSVPLTAGKTYVLVVRCPGATVSNKVVVLGDTTNIYADGVRGDSSDGGRSWTLAAGKDIYFETVMDVQSSLSPGRIGVNKDMVGNVYAQARGEATLTPGELLIPFPPEQGMTEQLSFLTDVMEKMDGSEQRMQLRKYPRRQYGMTLRVDGTERQWLDNVLSGRQAGDLYLPLWTQPTLLEAAADLHDTSISVNHAWQDQAEFREGGRLVIWSDKDTWEMIRIDTLGAGTISLATEVLRTAGYPVGTPVYPVVKVMCPRVPSGSIMGLTMADVKIELLCKDNESDIASAAAWDEVHGLPYLADLHLGPSLGYVYDFSDLDFATGKTEQETRWVEGKQSRSLILVSHDRATSWDLRCLLYYLSGRWKSFYLPTYLAEVPIVSLVGTILTIGNVGYSQYSAGRTMVRTVTSTADEVRTVVSSTNAGATEELTLDATVAGTLQRVEFVYRMRLDTDEVSITHTNALGTMTADMSVKSVPINVKDLDEDEE